MSADELKLLVVEDEEHLAAGLKLNLELEGYEVDIAGTAREAGERLLKPDGYDAIVLDVMLPDIDGFELCKKLRRSGNYTPVIMLTARSSAEDRVKGLESGADDYLVKPFELDELLARVRSMVRRRRWERSSEESLPTSTRARFGEAQIDFESHEASVGDTRVELTRLELDLLRYFVDNPGRVLSRDELLEQVWKLRNYSSARTVDNFISRLRKHFEPDPSNPRHFLSVRGAGYKFVP
ncbi:MAG: response regulator transcription factor [Sandaracinaceae bacterium]|nr:MAG: response regulator transcription factor [Sandaracinaceae bacterium]HBQ10280.1 DNA-binding response regulator [Myxococcales bacterium]